jgi:DNA repair protein SbcC/Rad50
MIPLQLTLKNFLSYSEATLNFRGLHTACICGANGAGKSSLLEAITWVIWGKSRTVTDDDIIHIGANDVRVDFEFICNYQTYRIIRSKPKGKTGSLEFQIQTESGKYRSLSEKGIRETQQRIIRDLRLDYDTFTNSAYLRQGRADEFMLRGASERKQVLADLLKLDQYDVLANKAKDISKEIKGQIEQLEVNLNPLEERLEKRKELEENRALVAQDIQLLQKHQKSDQEVLNSLQKLEAERQTWEQQLQWQQNQMRNLQQECSRIEQEKVKLQNQLQKLQELINQQAEITAGYQRFLALQQEEETLTTKFQTYQGLLQQKQTLEQQLNQQSNQLQLKIQQAKTRLESLEQQEKENQDIINTEVELQENLATLNQYRQRLQELDDVQSQATPLLQRRQILQNNLEKEKAKLAITIEQLQLKQKEYSRIIAEIPQLRQEFLSLEDQIKQLENKRIYQERVREKGVEKKSYQERLEQQQEQQQEKLLEIQQKLKLLATPEAICPLCEQELDQHYRHRVIQKTEQEQENLQHQTWTIKEQIALCERERDTLRIEYQELKQALLQYDQLLQKKGKLESDLDSSCEIYDRIEEITGEMEALETALEQGNYALELQTELENLNQELKRINYSEEDHALVRKQVYNLRWVEIKQNEIEKAKRRQINLNVQKPEMIEELKGLELNLENLRQNSPLQEQLNQLQQQIQELNYDQQYHSRISSDRRQNQTWQMRYQELSQASEQYPQIQNSFLELEQTLQLRKKDQENNQIQLNSLTEKIATFADRRVEIQELSQKIEQTQQQLNSLINEQGRLEQTFIQLNELQNQYAENCQKVKQLNKKLRVYQELAQAFGKNGIQAFMIENILPQLEAETNHILARLTGNQFHVRFVTQKAGKGKSKKKDTKLIDTLEILISDVRGTRAYETYSGGEAFRINFSIRLAIAKLLAQRSGTALQMLIIDEGFGTQDSDGCERLVAAINAIASDFACILTVTHMPQFKEAFQHRIEVYKTNQGSQLKTCS